MKAAEDTAKEKVPTPEAKTKQTNVTT